MTVPRLAATSELDSTTFGGRDNVLILGPSLGTAAPLWDDALPALSANYALVRWDLPGHGKSEPTDNPFTMAELAQGVIDLADAFGIDTFDYAGVSIGGAVALQLALDFPDRVKHSAVVCSAAKLGEMAHWQERADNVRAQGTAMLVDSQRPRWFTDAYVAANSAKVDALFDLLRGADPHSYARACEAIGAFDVRERLHTVDVPSGRTVAPSQRSFGQRVLRPQSAYDRGRSETVDEDDHLRNTDESQFARLRYCGGGH
jgi:hypothetical protein